MNRLAVLIAVAAAPFLLASTVTNGHLYGRFNDGVYLAPKKLFKLTSPFPEEPIVSDGQEIVLSGREWAVLDVLLARPGATVSKGQIEEALYAFGSEIESNTVEVYVSRVRKKLGHDHILTVRGVGYRLGAPASGNSAAGNPT